MTSIKAWRLLGLLGLSSIALPVFATDPCNGFSWNVKSERALFATPGQMVSAGKDVATAPDIETSKLL